MRWAARSRRRRSASSVTRASGSDAAQVRSGRATGRRSLPACPTKSKSGRATAISSFGAEGTARIRARVDGRRVVCALSGGVDSTVAALIIHRAVGEQLTCIFVDNGVLRLNEADQVRKRFERLQLPLVFADASGLFLDRLAGVVDPEKKRKIIGATFIDVFETEAEKLGQVDFLAQGTLYPDVIESGPIVGQALLIKCHHNVGGLPDRMT